MKKRAGRLLILWLLMFFPAGLISLTSRAAEEGPYPSQHQYTREQLDQLLAPIALYPDSLLAQILMASTYPLEVVEADRWLKENPGLRGQALDEALRDRSWDPSVKSLCRFPEVLDTMSERLNETAELGNAFLEQRDEVMNIIQDLRAKARAQGNLESTDRQEVNVEGGDITILPVEPEVIYVPVYNPCRVYGPWWYPACSPPWFWYPGLSIGVGLTFGPGIFIGPVGRWCGFYWHRHELFINTNRVIFFNREERIRGHGGFEVWRHNPYHRRGMFYLGPETRRRYGPVPRFGAERGPAYRGRGIENGISGRGRAQERGGRSEYGIPQRKEGFGPAFPGSSKSRRGNAFEGFGRNGNEIRHFSERGRESIGRAPRGGRYNGDGFQERGNFHGGGRERR